MKYFRCLEIQTISDILMLQENLLLLKIKRYRYSYDEQVARRIQKERKN